MRQKMKSTKTGKLFTVVIFSGLLIFLSAFNTFAQQGKVKFDYEYKSNAEGKLKAEQERGRKARMYWNAPIKRWTVEVDYGGTNSVEEMENDSQTDSDDTNETNSTVETRTVVYHYEYKSNAQGKLKTELKRGKTARIFYDKTVSRWAVEVEESVSSVKSNQAKSTEKNPKNKVNNLAEVGSGKLPNGATVSYFPDKTMAEEVHKAAIKQGDWTKIWYDETRRAWAVAIKIR